MIVITGLLLRWYIKAHEINPKNGKPYNQLALLAFLAVSLCGGKRICFSYKFFIPEEEIGRGLLLHEKFDVFQSGAVC